MVVDVEYPIIKTQRLIIQIDCYQAFVNFNDYNNQQNGMTPTTMTTATNMYCIQLSIAALKVQTQWSQCNDYGLCEWYQILTNNNANNNDNKNSNKASQNGIEIELPCDATQCPDVIMYLIKQNSQFTNGKKKDTHNNNDNNNSNHNDDDNIISYIKFKFIDFIKFGFDNPPKWYQFGKCGNSRHMYSDILLGIRAGNGLNKP